MKINVVGTVLNVREGVSKKSGKSYRIADIYDGEDLLHVFSAPVGIAVGKNTEIPCRLIISENGSCFIRAI